MKDNIKLGAGGIREIEFITQVFQLIRGGREPRLQERALLPTLQAVAELGLLPEQQVADLSGSYLFCAVWKTCCKPLLMSKPRHYPMTH